MLNKIKENWVVIAAAVVLAVVLAPFIGPAIDKVKGMIGMGPRA